MQYYCQQFLIRHFKTILTPKLLKVRIECSHIRLKMSDSKGKNLPAWNFHLIFCILIGARSLTFY